MADSPVSSKERESKHLHVTWNVFLLRYTIFSVLAAVAAFIGYYSETRLSSQEQKTFHNIFLSEASTIHYHVLGSFATKYTSSLMVSNIFATAIQNGYAGASPNITLPGFDAIMGNIGTIASLGTMTFSPLVTNITRHQWESFARANVGHLNGPAYLNTSSGTRWVVADGIGNQTALPHVYNSGFVSHSPEPTWLFPYWQATSYAEGEFMLDPRSGPSAVKEAINRVITTKKGTLSDIVTSYGALENGMPRPSSVLFSPIIGLQSGSPIVGLFSGQFYWEDVLKTSMSQRMDCVISSPTSKFTMSIDKSGIYLVSWTDSHETAFNQYKYSFTVESNFPGSNFTISIYPTKAFHDKYITRTPFNACILTVCLVVLPSLLLVIYMYCSRIYENKLIEERNLSSTQAVSRGAVLKAKKVYVRYISHEMRTPLNAAHLGLKILEKDMEGDSNYLTSDRLQIVREVGMACDMAVTILNDLLNYDKLEDQTMVIELKKIVAISYLLESFPIFSPQAKEKGVDIIFDIDEAPQVLDTHDLNALSGRGSARATQRSNKDNYEGKPHLGLISSDGNVDVFASYLTRDDFINVDEHKVHQVIRNIVSNAIKFTPAGKSVTIRARKIQKVKRQTILEERPDKRNKRSSFSGIFKSRVLKIPEGSNSSMDVSRGSYVEGGRDMGVSWRSPVSNHGDIESNVGAIDHIDGVGGNIGNMCGVGGLRGENIRKDADAESSRQGTYNSNRNNINNNNINNINNIDNINNINNFNNTTYNYEDCRSLDQLIRPPLDDLVKPTRNQCSQNSQNSQNNQNRNIIANNENNDSNQNYDNNDNNDENNENNENNDEDNENNAEEEEEEGGADLGMLVVDVVDLGVGMRPEDTSRLFKEIIQFNPGELQAGGGSGLGMMISKGIVDLHHGEISVHSHGMGLGCTFTLSIPLSKPPANHIVDRSLAAARDLSAKGKNSVPTSPSPTSPTSSTVTRSHSLSITRSTSLTLPSAGPIDPKAEINAALEVAAHEVILTPRWADFDASSLDPSMGPTLGPTLERGEGSEPLLMSRQLNVLVVDDSHLNRKMLVRLLKTENILCDEAVDGVSAVEKARERCRVCCGGADLADRASFNSEGNRVQGVVGVPDMYDAILMDFMMPNMDGPTATKAIRELGYRGVIIGVTGNALPSDIAHFIAHGADTVLTKPVNVTSLKDALRDIEVVPPGCIEKL